MDELTTEQKRKEYRDDLNYYRDGEQDAIQTLDKAVLTLTAAAYGLSIAISDRLVPAGTKSQEPWLLGISWLAFTISLTSTLISFRTSAISWRREQEYLNYGYSTGKEAPENRLSTLTDVLNTISVVACVGGIVSLAVFVWLNLPK